MKLFIFLVLAVQDYFTLFQPSQSGRWANQSGVADNVAVIASYMREEHTVVRHLVN